MDYRKYRNAARPVIYFMKYFIIIPIFGTLLHILGRFSFHSPIHYKAEKKFCVSICKSVYVHTHSQTKRPTALKFGTDILEKVFEKISKQFFKKSI